MKNNKGFALLEALLIFTIMGALVGVGWYVYQRQDSNGQDDSYTYGANSTTETNETTTTLIALQAGTFGEVGEYGTVQVRGYGVSSEVNTDPYCETNCEKSEYVFLNITESPNQKFLDYIKQMSDNSFAGAQSIGLGCLVSGQIEYSNSYDGSSSLFEEFIISKEDTASIMNATSDSPIALELERKKFTGGSGAPACYSHITTTTVL